MRTTVQVTCEVVFLFLGQGHDYSCISNSGADLCVTGSEANAGVKKIIFLKTNLFLPSLLMKIKIQYSICFCIQVLCVGIDTHPPTFLQ